MQGIGEGHVRAVDVEFQIVEPLDDVVESAFGGEDVGVRLEEAPVRLVEQEQQRIREARQAFREIAIGARGPFPDLRTFVEREHRLGMQVRGVVVVDVVEQIVMADVLADIADPVADVIGAEQAAVNRRRQPDQAPLARRPGRRRGWPHQAHDSADLRSRW